MTEANAGFRAFHYGTKEQREVDFVRRRQRLAEGALRGEELIEEVAPWTRKIAAAGLVNKVFPTGELEPQLDGWLQRDFLPRSAPALHFAAMAARRPLLRALEVDLPALERIYLDELMQAADASEGVLAFMEKRQPRWLAPR